MKYVDVSAVLRVLCDEGGPVVPLNGKDRVCSSQPIRALDAIHVATAEILVAESKLEELEFWTHDNGQATAALSRGLNVRGV